MNTARALVEGVVAVSILAWAAAGCGLANSDNREPKRVSSELCDCSIVVPGGSIKVPQTADNLAIAYASLRTGMGVVLASEDRDDTNVPVLVFGEAAADGAVAEGGIERDGPCTTSEIDGRESAVCPMKGDVLLLAVVPTPKRYLVAAITLEEDTGNVEIGRKLGRKLLGTLRSNEPRPAKQAAPSDEIPGVKLPGGKLPAVKLPGAKLPGAIEPAKTEPGAKSPE